MLDLRRFGYDYTFAMARDTTTNQTPDLFSAGTLAAPSTSPSEAALGQIDASISETMG
jgi:hypothetical protein